MVNVAKFTNSNLQYKKYHGDQFWKYLFSDDQFGRYITKIKEHREKFTLPKIKDHVALK